MTDDDQRAITAAQGFHELDLCQDALKELAKVSEAGRDKEAYIRIYAEIMTTMGEFDEASNLATVAMTKWQTKSWPYYIAANAALAFNQPETAMYAALKGMLNAGPCLNLACIAAIAEATAGNTTAAKSWIAFTLTGGPELRSRLLDDPALEPFAGFIGSFPDFTKADSANKPVEE